MKARDESQRWHQNLVFRPDAARLQGQMKRGRPGIDTGDRDASAQEILQFALESLSFRARAKKRILNDPDNGIDFPGSS